MAGVTLGNASTLRIIIPKKGDVNWAESIKEDCFVPICNHDHSGENGKGAKVNVKNLAGINIPNIVDGEILKWDSSSESFVASDLVVDITDGIPDTTKTAFQIYNTVGGNVPLQTGTGDVSILKQSTQLNSVFKIDTRQSFDVDNGKYVVQRAGIYDLLARMKISKIDSFFRVNLTIKKTDTNAITTQIFSKTITFDHLEPIGTIKPFASTFDPNRSNSSGQAIWLPCSGGSVDQNQYPILATMLNTNRNSANSLTLPNLNTGTYKHLRGASDTDVGETLSDATAKNGLTASSSSSSSSSTSVTISDPGHSHNTSTNYSIGQTGNLAPDGNERSFIDDGYSPVYTVSVLSNTTGISATASTTTSTTTTTTLSGDSETRPHSTQVKFWIKAKHEPQPIELSILADLDVDDKIYVEATFDTNSSNGYEGTPEIDMSTSEGFLFKGFRLV